jgi:NADH dehydrogenase FAD-containing subunit
MGNVGELKKLGVKVMTNVRIKKFEGKTVTFEEAVKLKQWMVLILYYSDWG